MTIAVSIVGAGCSTVASSMGGATNLTGDAWYTESIGFPFLSFSSSICYCYAPAPKTPALCKEARLVTADEWRTEHRRAREAEERQLRQENSRRREEDLRRRNNVGSEELLKPPAQGMQESGVD